MTQLNPYDDGENGRVKNDAIHHSGDQHSLTDGARMTSTESSPIDLERHAPTLSNSGTRASSKPFVLMATTAALLAGSIALLFNAMTSRGAKEATREREELVTVPTAPIAPTRSPPQRPSITPIPLAKTSPTDQKSIAQEATNLLPTLTAPPDSIVERRKQATESSPSSVLGIGKAAKASNLLGAIANPFGGDSQPSDKSKPSAATKLHNKDTLMLQGTFIRCALQTRIITDFPGFASCTVTDPVFSFTGKRLLLPKGTKIMGSYDMEPDSGRVAVIWERAVTPAGINVNMASPGADNLGSIGHPGHYSAHWASRISAALWISLFSDAFKYAAAKNGPPQTTVSNGVATQSPFESNTAITIQTLANQAVRRAANRPATVTIAQGTIVSIYVSKDVDFQEMAAQL